MEEQFSAVLRHAGMIVSSLKTPQSKVTALLRRMRHQLTGREKDAIRVKLRHKVSKALSDGGIPRGIIDALTKVFVNISMDDISIICAEPGEDYLMYLQFPSIGSLLRLRELIRTREVVLVMGEAVGDYMQRPTRAQLYVRDEDVNAWRFGNVVAAGKFVIRK